MKRHSISFLGAAFVTVFMLSSSSNQAWGQTVQLPNVERFSVSTTVSVPDRGSIFLGGVKRANSSRTSNGLFRPGSSIGLDRSFSGVSASVYIHDFEAMDKFLLGESVPGMSSLYSRSPSPVGGRSPATLGAARSSYLASMKARDEKKKQQLAATRAKKTADLRQSRSSRAAAAWLKLAESAVAKGQTDKARRYFERAKGYGSSLAVKKLAELKGDKPASSIASLPADRMMAAANASKTKSAKPTKPKRTK